MDIANQDSSALAELTADVVAAYVANNRVAVSELPDVIRSIHQALASLGNEAPEVTQETPPVPAVSIRKSITPDYIVCLEDGKHFKSMKRHLSTKFGMTPDDYRRRWGLPNDYPMVASGYSSKRSELALSLGLGRKKAEAEPEPELKAAPAKKPARAKKAVEVAEAAE